MNNGAGKIFQAGLFVLPVNGAFLVYSPLNGIATLLNGPALKLLQRGLEKGAPDSSLPEPSFPGGSFSGESFSGGALPTAVAELAGLLGRSPGEPPSLTGPLNPLFLGLLPTRRCNCNCAYCDFGAGRDNVPDMSPATAVAALDWYALFLENAGLDHMEVHFFGGEPLICRDLIETAVHRSRLLADRHTLSLHLEVSTNGLFEPEYAAFVGDYFHAVVLSLDGFEDVHNRHRPVRADLGSFAEARQTAVLLSRSPAELCLRCCVSSLNVHRLEEIARWFCEELQPSVINFEPLTVNANTRAAGLSPPDPYDFVRHYAKARALALGYGVNAVYAATEGEPSQTSFCPVGKDALIVAPDGRVSSCYLPPESWRERGLDMDVGRLRGRDMQVDREAVLRLRALVRDKPRCARCFCQWVCSGGCHVHHSWPGGSSAYDAFCIQTRLLFACRLLEEMNLPEAAQTLLADKAAMKTLALHPSDLFNPAE